MSENEISYVIRACIFKVFNNLGPGLLESVYEGALAHELKKAGLNVSAQVALPVYYDSIMLEFGYRIDLLVNEKVLIEIKSIETFAKIHHKQVLTYLRLSNLKLGLLVNFNAEIITHNIFRKVNGL